VYVAGRAERQVRSSNLGLTAAALNKDLRALSQTLQAMLGQYHSEIMSASYQIIPNASFSGQPVTGCDVVFGRGCVVKETVRNCMCGLI